MSLPRYALHAISPDGCKYVTYFCAFSLMPAKRQSLIEAGYHSFEFRDTVSGGIVIVVPFLNGKREGVS